jgi:hypothetical protein
VASLAWAAWAACRAVLAVLAVNNLVVVEGRSTFSCHRGNTLDMQL